MLVSACIVLYKNDKKIVSAAIQSLLNTTLPLTVYLVDNSPDESLSTLAYLENIIYIHNPSNPGFGAAHNIAIKRAIESQSNYHIVVNPDIYFEAGTVERIVAFMEANPDVGHLMPKVLNPDQSIQPLCKRNPTFFDLLARGFLPASIQKLFHQRIDSYTYGGADFNQPIFNIPYLSGCFMFFRTSTLKQVGFFDDRIFMYLEDADITRRFLLHSRTVYYPGAQVYHHYAGLTHKQWKFKWITIQSAITYFNKWGWFKHLI